MLKGGEACFDNIPDLAGCDFFDSCLWPGNVEVNLPSMWFT